MAPETSAPWNLGTMTIELRPCGIEMASRLIT